MEGTIGNLINRSGDVWARSTPEGPEEFDPSVAFAWAAENHRPPPEERRSLDEVEAMPNFLVTVVEDEQWVPGPRRNRTKAFEHGPAPPAAIESRGGEHGTLAYFDRLTDALGRVVTRASVRPERCPFIVRDYVGGRRIEVNYVAPPVAPGGGGRVYLVTDGDGLKVGYTAWPVAARIAGLQTGNPRTITSVVTVHGVGIDVELKLQEALGEHHRLGEWYDFGAVERMASVAGGWPELIHAKLASGEWQVQVH